MTSMKITGLALAGAALLGAATSPALAKPGTRSGAALPRQSQPAHLVKQSAKTPALAERPSRPGKGDRLREHLERRWHNYPGGPCGLRKFRFCNDSPG